MTVRERTCALPDEPVYTPTDQERQLLDKALDDATTHPDAGVPWELVRRELRTDEQSAPNAH